MLKKTLFTTLVICCVSIFCFSQNIIYVKQGAGGKGTSWADATGDLQLALAKATYSTQIWIAEGNYFPTSCTPCSESDRSISFNIPAGVELYGGFNGDEDRLTQRDRKRKPTRLSGNIGNSAAADNSNSVVFISQSAKDIVLDGLIIADGNANSNASNKIYTTKGGGLFFKDGSSHQDSKIEIKQCIFLNNHAEEGGAVFVEGSNVRFWECTFTNNAADQNGGAIFHSFFGEGEKPFLSYCQFVNNEAEKGGAVYATCNSPEIAPEYYHSTFANNKASNGSSLYFNGLDECPVVRTHRFINNQTEGRVVEHKYPEKQDADGLLANLFEEETKE